MIRYTVERQPLVIGEAAHRIRCFFANLGSARTLTDPPSSVIVLPLTKLVQQSSLLLC